MPVTKTLCLKSKGSALVANIDALEGGSKRFIGWKYMQFDGGAWAFVSTGEAETVNYHAEYVRDVKEGMLEPGDEATAKLCGVDFPKQAAASKAGKKDDA